MVLAQGGIECPVPVARRGGGQAALWSSPALLKRVGGSQALCNAGAHREVSPGLLKRLIGGKEDGSSRADSSHRRAEQSWAQDGRWEECGGCRRGRSQGQGPRQSTEGCSGRERAGQEAGSQRLGQLLLQGQF